MTASTTLGRTTRAFPVPGAIGLAVRVAPVDRLTPPAAGMAPVVRMNPPVVLAGSSAWLAPVTRARAGLAAVARTVLAGGAAEDSQGGRCSPGRGPGSAAGQDPVRRRP